MRVAANRAVLNGSGSTRYGGATNTRERIRQGKHQRVIAICAAAATFNTTTRKIDVVRPGAAVNLSGSNPHQRRPEQSYIHFSRAAFKQIDLRNDKVDCPRVVQIPTRELKIATAGSVLVAHEADINLPNRFAGRAGAIRIILPEIVTVNAGERAQLDARSRIVPTDRKSTRLNSS